MNKTPIQTPDAPTAIGTYSQAIHANGTVYLSGQIPLVPETMELISGDMRAQIHQVFKNLTAVAKAAGGTLDNVVKLGVFVTNMDDFPLINEVMSEYFRDPYPARAVVGVNTLPKGACVEMDAILVLE
uniref:Reactive intermediate/imine deaminase n=1 Tax=Candidatus Kentrum sp. FW TaxID=2126338 RepID=A0A450T612_9GAMM|nr:MAG: reactive intermediate/imine deaminase [Candidatus Kentron sp. FW]